MSVPVALRPATITTLFEAWRTEETPLLDSYWPLEANKYPGIDVIYDVLTDSRIRPRVNTRGGRANYVDPDALTTATIPAETWRDGRRNDGQVLHDLRKPGTPSESRGIWQILQDTKLLKNRLGRFMEWMAAEGLQGVKEFFPPGMDTTDHYDELLLTDSSNLDGTVVAAWNAASASQAAARTNLANIRTDFENAATAIHNDGGEADTVVWNLITQGYIDTQCLAAGYDRTADFIMREGHITRIFGMDVDLNDRTYIHPVSGAATKYIPDAVAVFLDSNNARSGRKMIECEAVHVEAPQGHTGAFLTSYIDHEAPGEVRITGEWTGIPIIGFPLRTYVYESVVTAA